MPIPDVSRPLVAIASIAFVVVAALPATAHDSTASPRFVAAPGSLPLAAPMVALPARSDARVVRQGTGKQDVHLGFDLRGSVEDGKDLGIQETCVEGSEEENNEGKSHRGESGESA